MAALSPGEEFAGYVIERVLATGGMGEVYLARHVHLGRVDALKVMRSLSAKDTTMQARFLREGQLAASLRHRNVVTIYSAGEFEGRLYLTMEYIEGSDLRDEIDRHERLVPRRATWVVSEAANALDAAHRHGLVHRDVKPANILLSRERPGDPERVLLTDFGITKSMTASTGLTGLGEVLGTLDYVAPEQIEGKPLDGRVDVYALGCVLYECLVGRAPFVGESTVAILHAHLSAAPPMPSRDAPGVPEAFDAVVAKAMAKDKADRYATCGELAAAATAALPAARETAAVPAPLPVVGPAIVAEPAARSRSKKPLVVGLVGLLVAAVVAALVATSGSKGADQAVDEPTATPTASVAATLPAAVVAAWDAQGLADVAQAWPSIVAAPPGVRSAAGTTCSPLDPAADDFVDTIIRCGFVNGATLEILHYAGSGDRTSRERVVASLATTQTHEQWTRPDGSGGTAYLRTTMDASGEGPYRWWTFDRAPTFAFYAQWPHHTVADLDRWWQRLPDQPVT